MYWVDINLVQKKGLKFYQTQLNAIVLYESILVYGIPKVVRMEIGEVFCEKLHASLRLSPKTSLKHDWMNELGSEIVRQVEGKLVVRHQKSSQPSQPNPNPDHD